jgi:hypothetical protein
MIHWWLGGTGTRPHQMFECLESCGLISKELKLHGNCTPTSYDIAKATIALQDERVVKG